MSEPKQPNRPRLPTLAVVVTAVLLLAVITGIALGKVFPVSSPPPSSPALSPVAASSNLAAQGSPSLSPTPEPTNPPPTPSPTPSAPPAHPVTATVEDQGIRLTLTLDRDRSSFQQRVWADVSVENVGLGVVYWGHSGTCAFAASVNPNRLWPRRRTTAGRTGRATPGS